MKKLIKRIKVGDLNFQIVKHNKDGYIVECNRGIKSPIWGMRIGCDLNTAYQQLYFELYQHFLSINK